MDGTEQTLFESTEIGEYSGYIFLDDLASGDTIELRVYVKDKNDDSYKKWIEDGYTGSLTTPAVRLEPMIGSRGVKITAKQTAGTFREITHQWYRR